MKKLFKNIWSILALSSMVLLYSCGGDDEETTPDGPTISITSSSFTAGSTSYTGTAGETVTITINVTAPGGFNNITADIVVNGVGSGQPFTDSKTAGTTVTSYTSDPLDIELNEDLVGQTVEITATTVDDNNLQATATLTLVVESQAANSFTAVLLAAPLADDAGTAADERTSLTWFSSNLGTTTSSANVVDGTSSSADIDFGYAYITEANLGAPASYPSNVYDLSGQGQNWSVLNATTFRQTSMTPETFAGATNFAALQAAYDAGTNETGLIEGLAVDQVIAFQTDGSKTGGSKRGLILVKEINGTFNENDNIVLDVIVQQ